MRLSSLWEMGPFSDLAGSVYISTHKSFDSLGEDCSDPDSWYIHMLLLQEDKLVSQNLWGRPLSISLWDMILSYPLLFVLFDRLSQEYREMPVREEDKKTSIPIVFFLSQTSFFFFNFILFLNFT